MEDFKQFTLSDFMPPRKPVTGHERHEVLGSYAQGIGCDQPHVACTRAAIMGGAFRARR